MLIELSHFFCLRDTCGMENANANVIRFEKMLFKELKDCLKIGRLPLLFPFVPNIITKLKMETWFHKC